MKIGKTVQNNILIIAGIGLPALVMIAFMVATLVPSPIGNPPKYNLVFAVQDYSSTNQSPLNVHFVVKDKTLYAQYTPNNRNQYYRWKKLYLYDAKTQKIKQLSFGFPANLDKIKGMKEAVVDATKDLKLDTTLEAPDGYQLMQRCYRHSTGLFGELFLGSRSNYPCLKKNGNGIPLMNNDGRRYYYPGQVQFIGWVAS